MSTYIPKHIKLGPAPRIGETPDGESKFKSWQGESGYYRKPETVMDPYKTDKALNGSYSTEELLTNVTICATMRATTKSKVVKKVDASVNNAEREFTKTQFMESFINQRDWGKILAAIRIEEFEEAFDLHGSSSLSVPMTKIVKVIRSVCGSDTPEFIHDRFVVSSRKYAKEGSISWMDFRDFVLPEVVSSVKGETECKKEEPGLFKLMNRPRLVDKNIGALGDMTTNYRENFNKSTPVNLQASQKIYLCQTSTMDGANEGTMKFLCQGTIKGTNQVPGYRGHMPKNTSNSRKLEHSFGHITHPVDNNLRLTQRGMGAVLGYTGHIPHVIEGGNMERVTGTDPRTSNGAAYGPVRRPL